MAVSAVIGGMERQKGAGTPVFLMCAWAETNPTDRQTPLAGLGGIYWLLPSLSRDALIAADVGPNTLNCAVAGVCLTEIAVAADSHRVGEGRINA